MRTPCRTLGGGEDQIAVAEAWQRVEQGELGLALTLEGFGGGEQGAGFFSLVCEIRRTREPQGGSRG